MSITTNGKTIIKEATIYSPLEFVWYAWTISERVSEWFAPEAAIEAREGGKYELYFVPGNKTGMNTRGCKVTKLKNEEELLFTWKGPDQFESIMNNEDDLTIVSVSFKPIDETATNVLVKHSGFKDHEEWAEAIKWHEMAWAGVLDSLKSALEKGKGNLCCQP